MINDQGEVINYVDMITGRAYCGDFDADIDALPDLTQPSTLGCLLALVREAHPDRNGCVPIDMGDGEWQVIFRRGYVVGKCEAEVLVAALEAAP